MRAKKQSHMHTVVLRYANGMTRTVHVKASTREIAEDRAMKRNPHAQGIKRG